MTIRNGDCVQCGYCCTRRECCYGCWDPIHQKCVYLAQDTKCSVYEQIVELEKDNDFPMMGSGCSSTLFNTVREEKIKQMNAAHQQ